MTERDLEPERDLPAIYIFSIHMNKTSKRESSHENLDHATQSCVVLSNMPYIMHCDQVLSFSLFNYRPEFDHHQYFRVSDDIKMTPRTPLFSKHRRDPGQDDQGTGSPSAPASPSKLAKPHRFPAHIQAYILKQDPSRSYKRALHLLSTTKPQEKLQCLIKILRLPKEIVEIAYQYERTRKLNIGEESRDWTSFNDFEIEAGNQRILELNLGMHQAKVMEEFAAMMDKGEKKIPKKLVSHYLTRRSQTQRKHYK